MNEIFTTIKEALLYFFHPDERIYFPYLVSSVVIAILLFVASNKTFKGIWTYLFPYKRVFHISTANDVFLLVINHMLTVLLYVPFLFNAILLAYLISEEMNDLFGYSSLKTASTTAVVLYSVVFFVVGDLSRYLLHLLLHKIPFLWEFHKVHHSAEVLTPITVYRSHPIESLMFHLRGVVVGGLVSGIFLWLYPSSIDPYMIWGVHVGAFVFNLLGANLRHSHVWFSFGSILERVFISPAQHLIHHSNNPKHHNKNMGSELAIWDWMFKTLYITKGKEDLSFGVQESAEHRNFFKLIVQPFVKAFKIKR